GAEGFAVAPQHAFADGERDRQQVVRVFVARRQPWDDFARDFVPDQQWLVDEAEQAGIRVWRKRTPCGVNRREGFMRNRHGATSWNIVLRDHCTQSETEDEQHTNR